MTMSTREERPQVDVRNLNDGDAAAINDAMAARIEQRRLAAPNRRQEAHDRRRDSAPGVPDRRMVCEYCFQGGDHPTAAHCLRALERPDRILDA